MHASDPGPPIAFLTCFFPAFDEEPNIGPLLDEALATLPAYAQRFEIVVIDDGSRDGTAAVVRGYAERDPRVRLVSHGSNRGYGHALRTGFAEARGDLVFFTDGDRQFRLTDLARLLPHLEGSDVVVGYRLKRNDPWHRLVVARVYRAVLHSMFGLGVRDVDCAFKLVRRNVLDEIAPLLRSAAAFVSPELLIRAERAGYRIVEVGVPHHPRTAGRPKGATPRVIARTLREIARMRRELRASDGTSTADGP